MDGGECGGSAGHSVPHRGCLCCRHSQLDIGGNNIGDTGAAELAMALEVNRTLTTVCCTRHCCVTGGTCTDCTDDSASLCPAQLDISYSRIGDAGAEEFAIALASNDTLTEVLCVCHMNGCWECVVPARGICYCAYGALHACCCCH